MRSGHYHAYTRGTARPPAGMSDPQEAPAEPQKTEFDIESKHTTDRADRGIEATESSKSRKADNSDGHARGPEASDTSDHDENLGQSTAADGHQGGIGAIQSPAEGNSGDLVPIELDAERRDPEVMRKKHSPASGMAQFNVAGEETRTWYKISDHHYNKVSLQEVLASEAYVLLYTRRS